MRWTWFVERDGECWSDTFDSPAAAIDAMAKRQGMEAEHVPDRMAQVGIFLATVRVTVTPLMVLRPAGVSGTPAPELVAIGEVNCFDTKGWPIIRRYPSSAKTQIGAQVFVLASGVVVDHGLHSKPVVDHEAANLRDNAPGVKVVDDQSQTAVLRQAREVLDSVRGNINPERGYADELEADVEKAIAAIDAAQPKGG